MILLRTPRLVIRRLDDSDVDAFAAYRSQPQVARFQSWDEGFSLDDARAFLAADRSVAPLTPGTWLQLAFEEEATGRLVGDGAVRAAVDQPDSFELGVTLDPASQGRGLAHEGLGEVARWLFEEHGAHRIVARCDDRNVRAGRLFESLGFRREGCLVDADWCKGEWTTLRLYALLATETSPQAPAAPTPPGG